MDREPIPQSTTTLTPSVSQSNNHSHHANSSPSNGFRNNEVRTVMLYRVPIIALVMDGQERLCLAQISNTLLKNFSYNEIHNRRVALGITCVQCTPVQLELLRRAGAMPVSSRRCGMITKREAERLCKSFLAETAPPKLPDSFSFDIYHQCAWGCRGSFTPSRYNSSRAKCIKCIYCGLFFSPNKFIFHSHRLPDSKYVQPDAANFNSWRRHIKLIGSPEPPDDVIYAWEARKLEALIIDVIQIDFLYELTLLKDVKAMFNGGSRKRAMTASLNSCSRSSNVSHQEIIKRQRLNSSSPESSQSLTPNTTISDSLSPKSTTSGGPTYFPLIPLPNKCYSLPSTTAFTANTSIQSSPMKALSSGNAADFRQSFAEFMWVGSGKPPALHIPYSCLLWPRPPSLASSIDFATPESNRNKLLFCSNDTNSLLFPHQQQRDNHQHWSHINQTIDSNNNTQMHTSAFKPVAKSSLNSVIDLDQPNNTSPKNDTITRSPSPSARLSHTSDDNDAEVDIIGEDGDESTFFAKRENNLLLFENEKQMLANRKNKSYSISESESNAVTDKKRFESVSREDMNLNFVGQFFDKIEGSNERKYKSPLNNVCSTALDLRNLSSLSRGNYFSV